ncbi:F0f1 ATP synthase subunit b [Plakobranchus ocellatus]|uniref:F0f1 ATP synthase subunit b n=1 Tax=Plakobranchus ocellatus TaxID=259542 RepID=A0AAV3Z215_9GAST|nr:F0f1 ATP synthase subunit b [Plakobranchus ocellatus]
MVDEAKSKVLIGVGVRGDNTALLCDETRNLNGALVGTKTCRKTARRKMNKKHSERKEQRVVSAKDAIKIEKREQKDSKQKKIHIFMVTEARRDL